MTRADSNAKSKSTTQNFPSPNARTDLFQRIFAAAFGALLGLALLKFGNPVIMDKHVDMPQNGWEWALNPWPMEVGHWLLCGVFLLGLFAKKKKSGTSWILIALPLIWLFWQKVSQEKSEFPELSRVTEFHFLTCVVCFLLGHFALGRMDKPGLFWIGLLVAFFLVLAAGFQQRFGGLDESRRYWLLYVYPKMDNVPPALMKKMMSDRIFGTLFYPNTLAAMILLLLPAILGLFWTLRDRFTVGARSFLMGATALIALACLLWSGSKGGWLLMLVEGFLAALFLPIPRRIKIFMIAFVLALGLASFGVKYAGFFRKGATSVVERFHYWGSALKIVEAKPVFGSGPGTFGMAYQRIKQPDWEMALLTHNDYLQQASDSGWLGFLAYTSFIVWAIIYPLRKGALQKSWIVLGVWLGVVGFALDSLVEFNLYIPAMAWVAFAFLGWLLAQTPQPSDYKKSVT